MSSGRMETEQIALTSTEAGNFQEQLDALEKCGFKKTKHIIRLLKKNGGDHEVVKALLEAESRNKESRNQERKKHRRDISSSSEEEEKQSKPKKSKEEKQKEREERKERKAKSSELINSAMIELTSWPAEGANLYLDGNNMLFVLGPIRKMALNRRKSAAESIIQDLAQEFAKAMGLRHCTLIYDSTKKNVKTSSFVVCSARPHFATSDDALVSWASQPAGRGLYVTSDRGLIERLSAVGSIVCKPKHWFKFVANTLCGTQVDDLDGWMQAWIEKREATLNSNANE